MIQVTVMFVVLFISMHEKSLKGTALLKNFSNYNGVICIDYGCDTENDTRTEVYRSVV